MQQNNTDQEIEAKVLKFISTYRSVPIAGLHLDLRLFHDLGIDGEDALEFIEQYSKEFNVKTDNFNFIEYFGEEGSLSPVTFILRLITTGRIQDKKLPLTIRDLVNAIRFGELKSRP